LLAVQCWLTALIAAARAAIFGSGGVVLAALIKPINRSRSPSIAAPAKELNLSFQLAVVSTVASSFPPTLSLLAVQCWLTALIAAARAAIFGSGGVVLAALIKPINRSRSPSIAAPAKELNLSFQLAVVSTVA